MFSKIVVLSTIFVICRPMDPKIGNYSDVIRAYNQCGLSRDTIRVEVDCFDSQGRFSPNLKNARGVEAGEGNWVVTFDALHNYFFVFPMRISFCAGVLIDSNWVLTAAHCLQGDYYRVQTDQNSPYSGDYVLSSKAIPHPKWGEEGDYPETTSDQYDYDIALIKLKTPIRLSGKRNFICLPAKNLSIPGRFLAQEAGYGLWLPRLHIGSAVFITRLMQTGVHQLVQGFIPGSEKIRICDGDSGGPIWMYEMGRAFVIGIFSKFDVDDSGCGEYGEHTFVPDHVHWILDTMRKNRN